MMADCKKCKEHRIVENTPESVPYIVHETAMARNERNVKRMAFAIIIAVILLFASNALWLWAWMQYDYESYEAITDNGGDANIIGQDGNIYNGDGEIEEKN